MLSLLVKNGMHTDKRLTVVMHGNKVQAKAWRMSIIQEREIGRERIWIINCIAVRELN